MEVWGADIGNAYLEATTIEKIYVVADQELEELQGHMLVIHKALYDLKSSGLRWSQRIHDIRLQLGFKPWKADPLTEFLPKRRCLPLTLMVQGWVHNLF